LRHPEPEERRAVYERCAAIAVGVVSSTWDDESRRGYAALLLDRLAADSEAEALLAADILSTFTHTRSDELRNHLATKIARCCLAFLGQGHDSDVVIAALLSDVLMPDLSSVELQCGMEALARLAELGLPTPPLLQFEPDQCREQFDDLVRLVARDRPDIAKRVQRLTKALEDEPQDSA